MKKTFCIGILFLLAVHTTIANDSLNFIKIQHEIRYMKSAINRLQKESGKVRNLYLQQAKELDSLRAMQLKQADDASSLAVKVGADISDANQKIDSNLSILTNRINARSCLGVTGILVAFGLLFFIYYILRRKISSGVSSIDKIRSTLERLETAQKAIQEEAIKLDDKLIEVLNKQIPSISVPATTTDGSPDHSLAKKVADEIVRIETNLSRMDASVKGYKQLARAVERIKDNFKANGYEIIDMIGKPYTAGMKAAVTFVTDESLEPGQQIITKVIKPQIDYQQQMIQAAQIEVSQPE